VTTRNHKKRHGVNREKSRFDRERHRRMMLARALHNAARKRWRAIMRLYWSGRVPDINTATQSVDDSRSFTVRLVAA
jgi:hypothetical protein